MIRPLLVSFSSSPWSLIAAAKVLIVLSLLSLDEFLDPTYSLSALTMAPVVSRTAPLAAVKLTVPVPAFTLFASVRSPLPTVRVTFLLVTLATVWSATGAPAGP